MRQREQDQLYRGDHDRGGQRDVPAGPDDEEVRAGSSSPGHFSHSPGISLPTGTRRARHGLKSATLLYYLPSCCIAWLPRSEQPERKGVSGALGLEDQDEGVGHDEEHARPNVCRHALSPGVRHPGDRHGQRVDGKGEDGVCTTHVIRQILRGHTDVAHRWWRRSGFRCRTGFGSRRRCS